VLRSESIVPTRAGASLGPGRRCGTSHATAVLCPSGLKLHMHHAPKAFIAYDELAANRNGAPSSGKALGYEREASYAWFHCSAELGGSEVRDAHAAGETLLQKQLFLTVQQLRAWSTLPDRVT